MRKIFAVAFLTLLTLVASAQKPQTSGINCVQISIQNGLSTGTTLTGTLNGTRLFDFVAGCSASVSKITYRVGTADASANLYDIGIYSNTGTLLCHTGAIAGTTSFPTANGVVNASFVSACTLTAGTRYLFGWTGQSATASILGTNWLNAQSNSVPSSGSTTSNGVLNSSVTPPADSYAVNAMPSFVLHN